MSDCMICDSCGATLRERRGEVDYGQWEWYCPNEECTGVLGNSYAYLDNIREDVVNKPNHYQLFPDMEVIEAIKKLLTPEELEGYIKGNVLKYRLRAGKKDNTEQDIKKAMRYEEWLND